jgi:hypothetical protein
MALDRSLGRKEQIRLEYGGIGHGYDGAQRVLRGHPDNHGAPVISHCFGGGPSAPTARQGARPESRFLLRQNNRAVILRGWDYILVAMVRDRRFAAPQDDGKIIVTQ